MLIASLALVLACASPPDATQAAYAEGQAAYAEGQVAYAEERFADAAIEMARAYEFDPQPVYLYNWAQAERLAGDCAAAVGLYERFLATEPTEVEAHKAEDNQRRCAVELADTREPDPPVVPPRRSDPSGAPTAPAAPVDAVGRRWHRDVLGGVLLGTGIATAGVGVGLRVGANGMQRDADAATRHSTYDDKIQTARTLSGVGIGAMVAGGALLTGAIIRYVVVWRRSR